MSTIPIDELAALSLAEPFGCTYLCGLTFPNNISWRQHELSSHRQAETWRCIVPVSSPSYISPSSTECGECFSYESNLASHLHTGHGIPSSDHAAWIADGHIHPEGQGNFWCGFCRTIVGLEERGVDAWTERLDHVEAHFQNGDSVEKGWLRLRKEERRNSES